jgi:hypothetical protein
MMKMMLRRALSLAVKLCWGRLESAAVSAVESKGPKAIDKVFDEGQAFLIKLINKAPLPGMLDELRAKAAQEVQAHGDKLQEQAKAMAQARGSEGIRSAFASAKPALLAAIERIN